MTNKKDILDKLAEEVDKLNEKDVKQTSDATKTTAPNTKKSVINKDDSGGGSLMDKLLEGNPVKIPKEGEVLDGTVIDISSNSILLDLGVFGTGIVFGKEIRDGFTAASKLKEGDQVSASLIDLENEDGLMELSVREASYDKAWDDIEEKRNNEEVITAKILDANKGGLITEINGIPGFLPVSQLSSKNYPRVEDGNKNKILDLLKKLVGMEMKVRVIDSNKEDEKLIVSEKAALSEVEKEAISELKVGDVVEGRVSGVVDFGAFVKFFPSSKKETGTQEDELEGLVHISELAWQLIDDPKKIVKTGDKVNAKIIGIDNTRISLSIRALEKDPWQNVEEKYKVGESYAGKVDKINHFGAFIYLDKDIHGLAHVSEFSEMYPGKRLDKMIEEGKEYQWKILSLEPKDHRMGLLLMAEGNKDKKDSESEKAKAVKKDAKEEKISEKKEEIKKKEE